MLCRSVLVMKHTISHAYSVSQKSVIGTAVSSAESVHASKYLGNSPREHVCKIRFSRLKLPTSYWAVYGCAETPITGEGVYLRVRMGMGDASSARTVSHLKFI